MPPFRPTAERWTAAVAEIKQLREKVSSLLRLLHEIKTKCTCGACDQLEENE